jgi:hypothetical protein
MIISLKKNSSYKTIISGTLLDYFNIKSIKEIKQILKKYKNDIKYKNDLIIDFEITLNDSYYIEHKYNCNLRYFELNLKNKIKYC